MAVRPLNITRDFSKVLYRNDSNTVAAWIETPRLIIVVVGFHSISQVKFNERASQDMEDLKSHLFMPSVRKKNLNYGSSS